MTLIYSVNYTIKLTALDCRIWLLQVFLDRKTTVSNSPSELEEGGLKLVHAYICSFYSPDSPGVSVVFLCGINMVLLYK